MNARSFEAGVEARTIATRLKVACEVSAVATRLGSDSGVDLPTSAFSQLVRDRVREQSGTLLRDNVGGVDVFCDVPNVRIANVSATATLRAAPDPVLAEIDELHDVVANASPTTREIVLHLNCALMRSEPVAQIVFAFSAVEMLGQAEDWSVDQQQRLNELAEVAERARIGTTDERQEVTWANRRGMHKLSLRQGVLRLLATLNLDHLKTKWDDLYGERSTLMRGLAPRPGVNNGGLALSTVSLCGRILLKAMARDIRAADRRSGAYYGVRWPIRPWEDPWGLMTAEDPQSCLRPLAAWIVG